MKLRLIKEKKVQNEEKPLPGMIARKPTAVVSKKMVKGGYDDATNIFTPGRWLRMPISDPSIWWHELPIKWDEIMPEWGAKERGAKNRLAQETWYGLHDRERHWLLKVSLCLCRLLLIYNNLVCFSALLLVKRPCV